MKIRYIEKYNSTLTVPDDLIPSGQTKPTSHVPRFSSIQFLILNISSICISKTEIIFCKP